MAILAPPFSNAMTNANHLQRLLKAYEAAPLEFQATAYWEAYREQVTRAVQTLEPSSFRSGRNQIFEHFGFNEVTYFRPDFKTRFKSWLAVSRRLFARGEHFMPYNLDISDMQEMAFHHCRLLGELTGSKDIAAFECSTFGNPGDRFTMEGKTYTMQFLGFYIRYCFANRHLNFRGDEVIVELGSGSGHQVELLKQAYPGMTILCFDLPAQLYLCEIYLKEALGADQVVSSQETIDWKNLDGVQKGKVHFLGNWQMPMASGFDMDIFWNAASFGEMEPNVVQNYLSFVRPTAKNVFLLQARKGKEQHRVKDPMTFEHYNSWLPEFNLTAEEDAWRAHMRLKESGGYFQAVWTRK